MLDYVAFTNGLLGPVALVPQLYTILTTHNTSGLSVLTWSLLSLSSFIWILYGVAHRAWPVAISSTVFFFFHASVALAAYFL